MRFSACHSARANQRQHADAQPRGLEVPDHGAQLVVVPALRIKPPKVVVPRFDPKADPNQTPIGQLTPAGSVGSRSIKLINKCMNAIKARFEFRRFPAWSAALGLGSDEKCSRDRVEKFA